MHVCVAFKVINYPVPNIWKDKSEIQARAKKALTWRYSTRFHSILSYIFTVILPLIISYPLSLVICCEARCSVRHLYNVSVKCAVNIGQDFNDNTQPPEPGPDPKPAMQMRTRTHARAHTSPWSCNRTQDLGHDRGGE